MPPLPAAPGVVRAAVTGNIGGAPFANIFHFLMDTTAGISNSQAGQIATGVFNAYGTMIGAQISATVTATACNVTDLTSASGGVGAAGGTKVGGGTATAVPANTCLLVKHTIARRYRGGHPRTYLPPMSQNTMVTDSTWSSTALTSQQTAFTTFITACKAITVTGNTIDAFVNVSYYSGHVLRPTPVIDVIQGSTLEATFATQRRRIGR